ncbi:PIN domain-containing protein [bacterium]|nr:PIN domain-containing protein [bacterium]
MKENLFIDSSAFFALLDKNDTCHEKSLKFFNEIKENFYPFTSDFILSESFTLIRRKLGIGIATKLGEVVFSSNILKIFYIDENLILESYDLFKKYEDWQFSFTDCSSFIVMKNFRISKAFCFDEHFVNMGFKSVPS